MLGKAVDLGFKFCVACGGQYLGNLLYDGSKYVFGWAIDQYERWKYSNSEAKYYPQVVK